MQDGGVVTAVTESRDSFKTSIELNFYAIGHWSGEWKRFTCRNERSYKQNLVAYPF